ncbi:NCS1 family nucleobase:cation symporter-1 [Streptomyces sp. SID10853]|uniref:NCS1 family nucleobase:cation symporter-1 n=1 Tax=Streptomyces sp. SID10853 TaxID=2706028 RepID=UPI0013C016F5|nr:NCS1 family nucleobase:cation symporter-1 [Streptomyces sp. SID10853]NDZ78684.1 NCS1 family nucleobase:cation symporter-1 [Streptomyces sp. SID10853]
MTTTADGCPVSLAASDADSSLTNPDLEPTPAAQRTWSWWHFATLWMGMVHNIFNFTWVGGLVALGMSVWQALTVALAGNLVQTFVIGLNGRIGARFGIPFAVWARSAFGTFGSNIVALLRAVTAIGWFGVQSYLAATACNLLLDNVVPGWGSLGRTGWLGMPANLWITMVIYWAFNFLIVRHGMDAVRRFETWAGPMVFVVMAVLLIWAVSRAGGTGTLLTAPSAHSTHWFWTVAFGPAVATYIAGSWSTTVLNIPDLTRFARSNRGQFWGTMVGLPIASLLYFSMAAVIVSTVKELYGKTYWNPTDVLGAFGNPVLSAVGALLLATATISVNIPANVISPAYDLTNLLPGMLTFRRGAYISIAAGFVCMPWKLMASSQTLFSVLDNLGAVLGPVTGILLADFLVLRRRTLDVPALYRRSGRYRAWAGFNPVGLGVLAAVVAFLFTAQAVAPLHWVFTYAWFTGVALGFLLHLAVGLACRTAGGPLAAALTPAGTTGADADTSRPREALPA